MGGGEHEKDELDRAKEVYDGVRGRVVTATGEVAVGLRRAEEAIAEPLHTIIENERPREPFAWELRGECTWQDERQYQMVLVSMRAQGYQAIRRRWRLLLPEAMVTMRLRGLRTMKLHSRMGPHTHYPYGDL